MQDRTKGSPNGATADSVKIGIVSQDCPGTKLSEEELRQIGQSVERAIAEHSKGLIKPKFVKLPSLKASGYVFFHCAKRGIADWLKALELWSGCGCRALGDIDLPRDHILIGYFLSSAKKPSEQVLQMIEGQNEDLDTGN
jgi:Domain of unknown function (DUF4780)